MFSRQSSQVKSVKLSSSWGKNERRRSLQLFSRVIDNFVVVVIVVITFSLSTRMFPFLCPLAPSLHAKSNQGELLNPHHTSNQSMVENGTRLTKETCVWKLQGPECVICRFNRASSCLLRLRIYLCIGCSIHRWSR